MSDFGPSFKFAIGVIVGFCIITGIVIAAIGYVLFEALLPFGPPL